MIVSINYSKNNFKLGLYPNPVTKGTLNIITSSNCNEIELYDVLGRLIKAENENGLQNKLSTTDLTKGVYFIRVFTSAGNSIHKIVVE